MRQSKYMYSSAKYSQQYTARTNEHTVTRLIVLTGLEVWSERKYLIRRAHTKLWKMFYVCLLIYCIHSRLVPIFSLMETGEK